MGKSVIWKTEIGWKILCLGNWGIWKRVCPGFLKKLYLWKKYLCKMIKILKNCFLLMMMINLIGNLNYLIWSLFERNVLKIKDLNCCLC